MKTELLFAGFGGQGILLMGKITAQAAMAAGMQTTFLPSYGPEMRGGTANCGVIVADSPIASPVVSRMDVLVAMNQQSLDKFGPLVREKGLIILDSTMADPTTFAPRRVRVVAGPFTKIASDLGNVRTANMVALGTLARETHLVPFDHIVEQMKKATAAKSDLAAMNTQALETGHQPASKLK